VGEADPTIINIDKAPAYGVAISELKVEDKRAKELPNS
jgi:hypothetical protein